MGIRKIIVFLIVFISFTKIYCQETKKSGFGLRYTFSYDFEVKRDYNFRVIHHIPVCSYRLNSHDFYVGPQYSYIFQPTPVANEIYENNAFGINFGYRYYTKELINNLQIFGQFNFSVFRIEFEEYQHGYPFKETRQEFVVENTATIGMNYKFINNKLNLFVGTGIGSYNGFFLMLDKFNLSNYIGVGYEL
jgi:hypothetical protein